MTERVYLTVAEVLAIHHHQIEAYGGSHGLRDDGALEAAVFVLKLVITAMWLKRPRL